MAYFGIQKRKKVNEIDRCELDNSVRFYRRFHELSQEELAAKIDVHAAMIYKIETRIVTPKITTVLNLSKALGIPVEELFFDPEQKPKRRIPGNEE